MNTKRWIALAITVLAIVGSLGLIKVLPFYATLVALVTFIAGGVTGYLFKKDIIREVEKVVEVIKEVPKTSKKKKS